MATRRESTHQRRPSQRFLHAIVDSMPEAMAVIDGDGLIVMVNRAWRQQSIDHGTEPGRPARHTGVGASYFDVCRESRGAGSEGSAAALEGIQAVVDGRLPAFSLEYPCHSPAGQRWFSMRVAPLGSGDPGAVIAHVDVTANKQAEDSARLAHEQLESLTTAVPAVLYQFRLTPAGEGRFLSVSKGVEDLFEVLPDAVLADHRILADCVIPEDRAQHRETLEQSARDLSPWMHEHRIRTAGGSIKWVRGQALPRRLPDGSIVWSGILVDITGRKQVEEALAQSEERWKFALEGTGEGVWDWNLQTGKALFSRRWKELFGYSDREIGDAASEWESRVHPDDLPGVMERIREHLDGKSALATAEFRMRCRDGTWRWTLGRGKLVSRGPDGAPLRLVGTNIDISERKQLEEQLHLLAFYDMLTLLPNRRLLDNRLVQAMAAGRRTRCFGALMFIDLDNFKHVNDQHGHAVGDLLLTEAARRLKTCVRESDTVARFGGDEFVVLVGALETDLDQAQARAHTIAEKVRARLQEPFVLTVAPEGRPVTTVEHCCSVSIGVTLFSGIDEQPDDVMRLADRAMYQAKLAGRDAIRFAERENPAPLS